MNNFGGGNSNYYAIAIQQGTVVVSINNIE